MSGATGNWQKAIMLYRLIYSIATEPFLMIRRSSLTQLTHPTALRLSPSLLRKEGNCGISSFFLFLFSLLYEVERGGRTQ